MAKNLPSFFLLAFGFLAAVQVSVLGGRIGLYIPRKQFQMSALQ
jgi:hypothetical protein